jgi:hypothetical protein
MGGSSNIAAVVVKRIQLILKQVSGLWLYSGITHQSHSDFDIILLG